MFLNHIKTAFRQFRRSPLFSGLNLLGLAVGMAACLAIGQFVRYEWSYDRQSPYAEDIWRVYCETITDGNAAETLDANTHSIIGPSLQADLPEVVAYTRMYNRNEDEVVFLREDREPVKVSGSWMVDPGFLELFPPEFLAGDPATCLTEPYALVITESAAERLFGTTDVMGRMIEAPGGIFQGLYTIRGLVADPPPNTHLKFNVLASYATRVAKGHEDNWDSYWEYNYFQTQPGTDPAKVQAQLDAYSEQHLQEGGLRLHMQALTDIHLHSDLTYEIEANGNARTVYFLAIAGLLILFIAFFNYVNMTTAKAITRAKEVGIRKVIGAGRGQLVRQFVFEGLLLNSFALILALAAVQPLLGWLGQLMDKPLLATYHFDAANVAIVGAILLAGLLVSCLYPAFVLSGYRPVQVLKGRFVSSREGRGVRKGLVVFQFACSAMLIISVLVVSRQLRFLQEHDLGLSLDQMMAVPVPELDFRNDTTSFARIQTFQAEVGQLPGVQDLALSEAVPGMGITSISGGSAGVHWAANPEAGSNAAVYYLDISPDFFATYGIELVAGELYTPDSREALFGNVIINEAARRMLGIPDATSAIGEGISYGAGNDPRQQIRAVVADFHIESLKEQPRPTLYRINPRMANGYFSLRIDGGRSTETLTALEGLWSDLFPLYPFEHRFLDEHFARQYAAEQHLSQAFGLFAGLAIFVACLGLFGLATFTTEQRRKEIGIRKIMGAGVAGIVALLSRDFLRPVLISLLIACPLGYYFMEQWLRDFAYRIDLEWWVFALAGLFCLGIAHLTVGFQSLKAALGNPVEALRVEN